MSQKILFFSPVPEMRLLAERLLQPDYEIIPVDTKGKALQELTANVPDGVLAISTGPLDTLLPFLSVLAGEKQLPTLLVAPAPYAAGSSLLIQKIICQFLRFPFSPHQLRAKIEQTLQTPPRSTFKKAALDPFTVVEE